MEYPIGTVCIYQNLVGHFAYQNGTECVIVGPLEQRRVRDPYGNCATRLDYLVHDADGEFTAPPHCLRRKDPPTTGEQIIRKLFEDQPVRQPEHA